MRSARAASPAAKPRTSRPEADKARLAKPARAGAAAAGTQAPADAPERKPGTVQSVEVALQILEGIADNDGLVRVNELARQLGMTKARVSRHMQTLLALGLVARGRHEGYTFGWKLLHLSRAAVRDRSLVDLAKPHMQTLRDEVNHSVILSLPAPDGAVVISSAESHELETVTVRIAGFLPSPSSPAGRLAVALQNAPAKRKPGLLRQWPEQGVEYEVDTGRGVGGIAAPVFDEHRALLAVVSIVAPAASLLPQPSLAMVAALQRCVHRIEIDHMR